ncbi:succinate dehydrogenase/fumarate reductase iron-sulfur subunit [Halobacteriovorax sp. HLS]|uniref:succinate dehydrogenase/fumarate reductase iron-sulfur subunit n=1 Tax=Halobacteriovorax sp. HLS TaxID=2234000 RepID=UPI000FDAE799|nr:succinate dehydrogenase/fumarate reductase iron-sulfur subunit [Halobacteriovorax sp. HLS]
MKVFFKIWRQLNSDTKGQFHDYEVDNISSEMSFLEALDTLNESLVKKGESVIAFDHDCREGICGQCGVFINGRAHGPNDNTTTCQLHMRSFSQGDTIVVEPWRAKAFRVVKDLVVDRSSFDRIIQSGGFMSTKTGTAPEANSILIGKDVADYSMDAAACIGCGACVATCKNSSAALFTSAKITHLNSLPQGSPEQNARVLGMTNQMELEDFGHCSFTGACEIECPEQISISNIARMNHDLLKANLLK